MTLLLALGISLLPGIAAGTYLRLEGRERRKQDEAVRKEQLQRAKVAARVRAADTQIAAAARQARIDMNNAARQSWRNWAE